MTKEAKIPKRIQKIVDTCRGGQRLTRTLPTIRDNMRLDPIFRFEPSGREAPAFSAMQAISSGLLVPCRDGLFGAEFSQTFVAAEVRE